MDTGRKKQVCWYTKDKEFFYQQALCILDTTVML